MSSAGIEIEIVDSPDGLRALGPAWRELCSQVPGHGHYLSYDWHWRAWDSFYRPKGYRLCIAALRRRGRLVLILPLVVMRGRKLRRARWLGAATCYYPGALILADAAAGQWLEAAWRAAALQARIDYAEFNYVRDDGALHALLTKLPGARLEPVASIGVAWRDWADWDAYWNSMSKSLRRNQGVQYRRLERLGGLVFETVSRPAEITATIDWMIGHKRQWLAARGFYGDRFDDAEAAFVHNMALDCAASGALYLGRLRVGETIIAAELGVIDERRQHALITSYDRAWHKYSPGRLMYENSLKWSCHSGIPYYDFNAADDPYKLKWGRITE
ncbi:MAG: GNAT family N-acetyltransferase, partial [Alphaproteobacteria bacterium]